VLYAPYRQRTGCAEPPWIRPAPLRSIWVQTALGRLHARTNNVSPRAGTPTIILVHGLVISSRYMIPIARQLAPLCRVYALDLPGYGASEKPPQAPTVAEAADAVAGFMDGLGIASAHLLGNSYGCQICAEFAVRYPERLQRLILQGPTVNPHKRSFWGQLWPWLNNVRYEPFSLVLILLQDAWAAGLRRTVETVRNALTDRIEDKLPRIQAPTLIVRGAKDPHVPQRWAEEAARLLPHGELEVVPGYGHCLVYSAPLELSRVIVPFFRIEPPKRRRATRINALTRDSR
jgi:2-hydroxy-6-oxonona-2,4-dienedioate hydrolase